MADENQVVNYNGNKISLYSPEKGQQRDIVYVRPGDEIDLNFDIRDSSALKVEVINGDVHIVFANGSTLTLASMAAIGFIDNSPQIKTLDGKMLSLEEFLSVTEVLNYNEAVLILANKNQIEYSETEPKLVQVSSDQDAENDAGIPISGQGNTDIMSNGVPSDTLVPDGTVAEINFSVSKGSFVSTIWTTDSQYILDKSNYLPGETTSKDYPNLQITAKYGSQLTKTGTETIDGVEYTSYGFATGLGFTDDATTQLIPNDVNASNSNDNLFINNYTDEMSYVFSLDSTKGVFPNMIEITVPSSVDSSVTLDAGANTTFSSIRKTEEGTVYTISDVHASGKMEFKLSFPNDMSITSFDLGYKVKYVDPTTGEYLESSTKTSISLYPVTSEDDLTISNGFVLSTRPNPVDVKTGTGDDIIVGGGGNNIISSRGGDNKIFTYGGSDIIETGSGNSEVWASMGDSIIKGGAGDNKLYYDNRKTGIDPTGNTFKDSYYNTNKSASGVSVYLGYDKAGLTEKAGDKYANSSKITDDTILIEKSQGKDVVTGFRSIYLSSYNDTVTISDKVDLGSIRIEAGQDKEDRKSSNKIKLDDDFSDATVRIFANGDDSTIEAKDGSVRLTFAGFQQIVGSKNNDTYYSGFLSTAVGTDIAITIDGNEGHNTISYENMEGSIDFNANTGAVQKIDLDKENSGIDRIKNIQEITGTAYEDTFHGSFSNNYIYHLSEDDKVTYDISNAGITVVLSGENNDINVYKTTSYEDTKGNISSVQKDVLTGDFSKDNLSLSKKSDVVIVTDSVGSYKINAGLGGKNTLSYKELDHGITLEVKDGKATVNKGSGVDTFENTSDSGIVYKIIGADGKDNTFKMDASKDNKYGYFLQGGSGEDNTNTLSYENYTTTNSAAGISFIISGGNNSTATRIETGVTDYFVNINNFVGSNYNDTVTFSSTVKISEINSFTFDLGVGQNTVSYSLLNQQEADHIEINFDENDNNIMIVSYYKEGKWLGKETDSTFKNASGVYGTTGYDVIHAKNGVGSIFFDGYSDNNTADYSEITDDVIFHLNLRSKDNVQRGPDHSDTLLNVNNIITGSGKNYLFLGGAVSYKIDASASKDTTVSYHYSSSGISYNLSTNVITKGSGDNQKEDTLLNVTSVKGSKGNDTFYVEEDLGDKRYFALYGNDIWADSPFDKDPSKAVNPSNDTDIVDFSRSLTALTLDLDTTLSGSYNVFDENGRIISEGHVEIEAMGARFDLYHIEGFVGSTKGDTFNIMSSYEASKARTKWIIDGGAGTNTVDYSGDNNLKYLLAEGTDYAIQVTLSSQGASVARYYNGDTGNVRVEDTLTNISVIMLANNVDSLVTISEGWQKSNVTEIFAGTAGDKGNTLSFLGLTDDLKVNIDTNGQFSAKILGSDNTLPGFHDFTNIRLSQGTSTIIFANDSNFETNDNPIRITTSYNRNSQAILDFTNITSSITLELSDTAKGVDTLSGNGITGQIAFENTGILYTVIFAEGSSNKVYGSIAKNMNFTSEKGIGSNELTYEKIASFGITIDISSNKVIKQNNSSVYDTFDSSFTTIKGTAKSDILLITSLDVDLESIDIYLGTNKDNKIEIDVSGGVSYDIMTTAVSQGETSFKLSKVVGVDSIVFGDNHNDTIKFSSKYSSSASSQYASYDGGLGNNVLDFSELNHIIYDANNFKISSNVVTTSYDNIVWDKGNTASGVQTDLVFKNFYTIHGAKDDTVFYGSARGNFEYISSKDGHTVLDYSKSTSNVYIYLFDYKILKSNNAETVDKFDKNLNEIKGSTRNDTLIINKIPTDSMAINIDAGVANNTVKFDFDKQSATNVEIDVDNKGVASFALVKDNKKTKLDANLNNFSIYELTENDNKIRVDASSTSSMTFKGKTQTVNKVITPAGKNEIIYTGSSNITFEASRGIVTKANGEDKLQQISIISNDGNLGNALFIAGLNVYMTYKGDSTRTSYDTTNYSDAVIDYSRLGSGIRVDFKANGNGLFTVYKDGENTSKADYFDSNITKIIGTSGNDTFILGERPDGSPDIKIEGGLGDNSVSYKNYSTNGNGAKFKVDEATGVVSIVDGGEGFKGYIIDTNTVKGIELTSGNDVFMGAFNTELSLNGGKGIDTLDYSSMSDDISITVDFSGLMTNGKGTVTKYNTKTNKTKSDVFENFESVKTGNGDATIIINNQIIGSNGSGNFEVGTGNNKLDATQVSYGMDLEYGKNGELSSKITYKDGEKDKGPYDYNGFQTINLGEKGVHNEVHYYHDASYEQKHLEFTTLAEKDHAFYFSGTGKKEFYIDATDDFGMEVATISGGESFLSLSGFTYISAKDTQQALHIKAAGLNGEKTYLGGTTKNDSINYEASVFGTKASMVTDKDGQQYIEVVGISSGKTYKDKLYGINYIALSNNDNIFEVADITNYSSDLVIVDGGSGGNNELSFIGKEKGEEFDTSNLGGITSNGYEFNNFQTISLTGGDDIVYFHQSGSNQINANKGNNNKADYSESKSDKKTFTAGVTLSISKKEDNTKFFSVNKLGSDGDVDSLENFQNLILTDFDDSFVYSGSGDNFGKIKIDMGKGYDTVDFYNMDKSVIGTEFKYDSKKVLHISNTKSGIDYEITNMNRLVMGGTNSSLVIETLPPLTSKELDEYTEFDGGNASFNTELDLSNLNNGTDITIDLYNEKASDISGSLALSFKNFRQIKGSDKISTYIFTDTTISGEAVSYQVNTANKNAEIDYSSEGVTGNIVVNVGSSDATIEKSNGMIDSITGGFSNITGSSSGSKFIITEPWSNGLVLDGVAGSESEIDMGHLKMSVSLIISLDKQGNSSAKAVVSTSPNPGVITNNTATFKNFTVIRGSNTSKDSFVLNINNLSSSYIGTTLYGGTNYDNSFALAGKNNDSSATTMVSVSAFDSNTNNQNIAIDSVINEKVLSVSLINFSELLFNNSDSNVLLSFVDYENTQVAFIKGNKDKNNTLDLSSSSSKLTISSKDEDGALFKLDNDVNTRVIGFNNIILGNSQDIITVSAVIGGLTVNSGGSGSANPDELHLELGKNTYLLISDYGIGVSEKANSITYSTYQNFPVIIAENYTYVNILDSAFENLNKMKSLTAKKGGVISFYADENLVEGSSTKILSLYIENGAGHKIESGIVNLEISGFNTFSLGKSKNTVYITGNIKDKPYDGAMIVNASKEAKNTLEVTDWDQNYGTSNADVAKASYLQIDYNKSTETQTVSMYTKVNSIDPNIHTKTFTGTDFYTININGQTSNTNMEKKVVINSIGTNDHYSITGLEHLELGQDFADLAESAVLDGSGIIFKNNNGSTVDALWTSEWSPYITWGSNVTIDHNYELKVYTANGAKNNGNYISRQYGVYAPKAAEGVETILNLSEVTAQARPLGIHRINLGAVNSFGFRANGFIFNQPDDSMPIFYNFNTYYFSNAPYEVLYGQGILFDENWTLTAGGSNKDVVKNYENYDGFTLERGHIIHKTGASGVHTWYGVETFTGFSLYKLSTSEYEYQESLKEADISSRSLNEDDQIKSKNVEADQVTYSLPSGDGEVIISDVKNNTVVDAKNSDNVAIMLSGNAVGYTVEQFSDDYIYITTEEGTIKKFATGGSYLVVTDDDGNKLYILYADFSDVKAGGNKQINENGEYDSSPRYLHASENYDSNLPVENENEKTPAINQNTDNNKSPHKDGATSFGRAFAPMSDDDSSLSFDLVEDDGLDMVFDDEINLDLDNNDTAVEEEKSEDTINVSEEESPIVDENGDEDQNQNEYDYSIEETQSHDSQDSLSLSEETLSDLFSREDDSLDTIEISLDVAELIDISAINENLIEEAVIQESDIDTYKLESERNEDGILKGHNQNGSNGNGGLGSF